MPLNRTTESGIDEAKMSKKDAKIRGHQMALKNAQNRGDRAGVQKQRAALASLGAISPRGGGKTVTRHKGKANPGPRKASSMRGGKRYRHNPADADGGYAFEKQFVADQKAAEAANEKVADKKEKVKAKAEEAKEAKAEARDEKTPEAKKRATAAERALAKAKKALEAETANRAKKAADRAQKAAARAEKAAERAAYIKRKGAYEAATGQKYPKAAGESKRKPRKGSKDKKKMAKLTKKERSAAAKKGARTRKRNANKSAASKSTAKRKPASRKGKAAKRKAAKKPAARKGSSRGKRFPRVPKGFRRLSSRVSVKTKNRKTGRQKSFVKTRSYKSNPMSDLGQLAVLGGGVLAGAILADLLRRFVVTMAPKGGKEPFYGNLASERIDSAHPTGMAYAAQGLLGAGSLGLAYAVRRKSPGAATFLAGLGIGALVQVGLDLFSYVVAPAVLKSKDINEKVIGNRLYPLQQEHSQKYVNDIIKGENKGIEAGGAYKPDGTAAGFRGQTHGLPQGQGQRQLPPANTGAFRPAQQNTRGGQVAGLPQQATGQVGCPGGGCGQGGCTGGRNCNCPSCRGDVSAPPAEMGATTAGVPARPGNVNGPRQIQHAQVVSFMPRVSGSRNPMVLAR